ncbi:hypothetical protein LZ32DRAFT_83958 [Colletotrichum eremochloae]|nr:hypothetical protein LZ32DRAFT_83958 [Colletotrichum eremochloae]
MVSINVGSGMLSISSSGCQRGMGGDASSGSRTLNENGAVVTTITSPLAKSESTLEYFAIDRPRPGGHRHQHHVPHYLSAWPRFPFLPRPVSALGACSTCPRLWHRAYPYAGVTTSVYNLWGFGAGRKAGKEASGFVKRPGSFCLTLHCTAQLVQQVERARGRLDRMREPYL